MAEHTAQQILSWCVPYIPREGGSQSMHSLISSASRFGGHLAGEVGWEGKGDPWSSRRRRKGA